MLVPALMLTVALGAVVVMARGRQKTSQSLPPIESEYLPQPKGLGQFHSPPRSLEVAHASRSGAMTLEAIKPTNRSRPGPRCVEEIRRRCHEDFAGALNFLEGQMNRRVSDDPAEQSRYLTDLAEGLRGLNLHESLPALLRRADDALDLPHGDRYASEVVCFAAFAEFLHDPLTAEGQSALRLLRVAMENVRTGRAPVSIYAEAAFGDACRRLAENCPDAVNPRLVLAFIEAIRHCRRSFHSAPEFREDGVRRQTVRWQHAFMRDAEPVMREYLHDISGDLIRMLDSTQGRARTEILRALIELHADTDDTPLTLLGRPEFEDRTGAIKCLRWSKSPLAVTALTGIARHALTGERTPKWLRRLGVGKAAIPADEVKATLWALRGHPSEDAERVLIQYATAPAAEWRKTALQSLGWWEPTRRSDILTLLRTAKQDPHPDVRRAAIAASARLGECAALQMIRELFDREENHHSIDAVRLCGSEGLSWLWPDLDELTESDDPMVAAEAWEAIERMREEFLGPLG